MDGNISERKAAIGITSTESKGTRHNSRPPLRRGAATNSKQSAKTSRPEEMKYAVIFEKSATGRTIEQTAKLIREAMAIHVEGMREDGEKIPQPSTVTDYVSVSA